MEEFVRDETELEKEGEGYGEECEGEEVVDEVLVAEFYVLELDGIVEIRH